MNLYIDENFLDGPACERLIHEMRRAESAPALTYGKSEMGSVDHRTRNVRSANLRNETTEWVVSRLNDALPQLQKHFNLATPGSWERPEFLCYAPGAFFVAHQDGNTGLVRLESDLLRRISVSIFLNRETDQPGPNSYGGGSLVFTNYREDERLTVRGDSGKLVAFRSEWTHEVIPVTHGDRFAIVSWYRVVS